MSQTISFVIGDNRNSGRQQGRRVVEEVKGCGCPRAVAINTSGIPQNNLYGVYRAVLSSINQVEMHIPPAQRRLHILGSRKSSVWGREGFMVHEEGHPKTFLATPRRTSLPTPPRRQLGAGPNLPLTAIHPLSTSG